MRINKKTILMVLLLSSIVIGIVLFSSDIDGTGPLGNSILEYLEATKSTIQEELLKPTSIQIINTGWWAGECIMDCEDYMTLTSDTLHYEDISISSKCPQLFDELSYSEEWNSLIKLVDLKKFNALPDRIGRPGETDAAIWHIEISDGHNSKRVSFEISSEISGNEEFAQVLREMLDDVELKYNDVCLEN